jgi:hypothetical protein
MSPPPVVLTSFEVNVARRLAREEHPALLRMQASSHATDLSCAEFVERVIARPPFELV